MLPVSILTGAQEKTSHLLGAEASGYQLEQLWESRHDELLLYSLVPTWKVLRPQLCLRPKAWGHSLKLLMNPCRLLWSELLRQNQHRTNAFPLMFASWKLRAKISLCKNRKKHKFEIMLIWPFFISSHLCMHYTLNIVLPSRKSNTSAQCVLNKIRGMFI